jgi:SAM-dependent methyltransferase
MEPYGLALVDFFNGDTSACALMHRDDGFTQELPISIFFLGESGFPPLEQTTLDLCRGHVLDVGAGAGRHALVLQGRGLSVCAIDICREAAEIMRKRKVEEVHCVDISEFRGGPFDTILMLGHGIGMVETLMGLDHFLNYVQRLLKPEGIILLNSMDARCTSDPSHLAYHEANRRGGRYFGETRVKLEFKGRKGPLYGWLHVDSKTLAEHALKAGWSCEIICQGENGDYLAQLALIGRKG